MSEALMVLGWWELPEEDQPPPEMWGVDSRLKEWWSMVEARRAEKYGTAPASEPMETVPQTQNEYAAELLRGT